MSDGSRPHLPTFLGIGVPRAGTSWLVGLLQSHPEIYMPTRRKELNYFNDNYSRGIGWYESFFPKPDQIGDLRAIGEFSPYYLYCEECPERIRQVLDPQILVVLRHPVERAWSQYGLYLKSGRYAGSFEDFISGKHRTVLDLSTYSSGIERYLEVFEARNVLILIYEEMVRDVDDCLGTLGSWLGVNPQQFERREVQRRVNRTYMPRHQKLYSVAHRAGRALRKFDLDRAVNVAKRAGFPRVFGERSVDLTMRQETRRRLARSYGSEIDRLEDLLGRSLDLWRE